MPLPDFIIIGAMKAGTSTLHSNLQYHPDIGMSRFKEPSFFNYRFAFKTLEWYKNQFSDSKKFNGESSPNYSKVHSFPGTAQRMFETVPNIKLIYLTRDPIERIISHMHHNLYRDRFQYKVADKIVIEDENYILTSSYYLQLQEYLRFYNKDQFLFITTEDLKSDLNATLNKICRFLGAEEFDFRPYFVARNKSEDKYLIKYYDKAKAFLPAKLMNYYHWLFWMFRMKIDRPALSSKSFQLIYAKLQNDIETFAHNTGVDLNRWKKYTEMENKKNQRIASGTE